MAPLSAAVILAVGLSTFVCADCGGVFLESCSLAVANVNLSSYCQLFTRDNIPSGNEDLASLARPYFPTVWFRLEIIMPE